jgi:hypothetical protein
MNEEWVALGRRLSAEGSSRFPRWDEQMWQLVIEGPASSLIASNAPRAVLESYLTLAAEAVGRGYLYPAASMGRESFFTRSWLEWLPAQLPSLAAPRQGELLALCWNLGENLERGPRWLERIFLRLFGQDLSLDDLEPTTERVSRLIFEPPVTRLTPENGRVHWVHMGGEDALFLPGRIIFLAPTVVSVADRQTGLDGNPRTRHSVWLCDPPLLLGPIPDGGGDESDSDDPFWDQVQKKDRKLTTRYHEARNDFRAACTFSTSQFLAALIPE